MKPCPWPVSQLLPHGPALTLLDEALAYDDDGAEVAVTIRSDHPFAEPEGVPAHVGIELMAQACGVHAGCHAVASGGKVRLGYLLGTRRYLATEDWFRPGERLVVTVRRVADFGEMATYDCRIVVDGILRAEAQLNLYQPDPHQPNEEPHG